MRCERRVRRTRLGRDEVGAMIGMDHRETGAASLPCTTQPTTVIDPSGIEAVLECCRRSDPDALGFQFESGTA